MSITRYQPGKILSAAVAFGDTVYVAGTVADKLTDSVKHQAANILKKIDKLLAKAGSHKSRILSATIWLSDIRHRDKMNEAWLDWLDASNPPARACIEAKLADPLMLVEIAVVAALRGHAKADKPAKPEKSAKPAKPAKPEKAAKPAKAAPVAPKAAPAVKATKTAKVVAKAAPKVRDDLELIEGIGPKIAKILNDAGISTFQALATTPAAAVQKLLDQAGPRFAMAEPGTWAEQARLLARGDRAAFQKLTERLTGGVRK